MADIKISQLGAALAVNDSDLLPIVSNGNTLKAPASLVKNYAVGNTDLSGIGDGTPTGAIAALNTDKQPKTLATPITVDDTPQTTVEGALGAINTDLGSTKQALAKKALVITLPNVSTSKLSFTSSDVAAIANVTADHVVIESVLSNPSAQLSDWTITTASNSIIVSGTVASGATTNLTLTLIQKA